MKKNILHYELSQQELLSRPANVIESLLTKRESLAFGKLLQSCHKRYLITLSIQQMADLMEVGSYRTAHRYLNKFVELGLMSKKKSSNKFATCAYRFWKVLLKPEILKLLSVLFFTMFQLAILAAESSPTKVVRPSLGLNVFNLFINHQYQISNHKPIPNSLLCLANQLQPERWHSIRETYGEGMGGGGVKNPKRTLSEFEALFNKSESLVLDQLSAEQAQEVSQNQQFYKPAHQAFTKDLAAGKPITSHANYFMSIFRRLVRQGETSKTGMNQNQNNEQAPSRPKEWQPYPERVQEDPLGGFRNIEQKIHDGLKSGKYHPNIGNYPNLFIKCVTPEQAAQIMMEVHTNCACRAKLGTGNDPHLNAAVAIMGTRKPTPNIPDGTTYTKAKQVLVGEPELGYDEDSVEEPAGDEVIFTNLNVF